MKASTCSTTHLGGTTCGANVASASLVVQHAIPQLLLPPTFPHKVPCPTSLSWPSADRLIRRAHGSRRSSTNPTPRPTDTVVSWSGTTTMRWAPRQEEDHQSAQRGYYGVRCLGPAYAACPATSQGLRPALPARSATPPAATTATACRAKPRKDFRVSHGPANSRRSCWEAHENGEDKVSTLVT